MKDFIQKFNDAKNEGKAVEIDTTGNKVYRGKITEVNETERFVVLKTDFENAQFAQYVVRLDNIVALCVE